MGVLSLVMFLIVGAAAGWLAGNIMKGGGFGPLGNLVVGVIGSFVGGILFWLIGFRAFGLIGNLISATVGAVVLLWLAERFQLVERLRKG
jgi:uncharacterized membrane protein YeaQ/YmgE (transglycosylase-associated protein family)